MSAAHQAFWSADDFARLMPDVAARLLGECNARHSKPPRDVRWGTNGSMAVNLEAGTWFDHEAGVGGGVLDLVVHRLAAPDRTAAAAWMRSEGILPEERKQPEIEATYDYEDEHGNVLFQVVRLEPKTFRQRRPDGRAGYLWNLDGVRRVLYHLPEVLGAGDRWVLVVEGEKDADALRKLGFIATTNAGGAGKWLPAYNECLRDKSVLVLGDNDQPGHEHVEHVAAALHGIAKRVRVLDVAKLWPECPHKGDISDWLVAGGTAEKLNATTEAAVDWKRPSRLRVRNLAGFLALEIKPREMVLAPVIPEKGLAMLYASRGIGKTHFALGIAYAVATGGEFLKWKAPKARRVLLIDGEMPAAALQERFSQIVKGTEKQPAPDMLNVLCGDLVEESGIGNLANSAVQAEVDALLDSVEFLILDNLSSLTAVIRDNDAESWGPVQDWLLRLRRRGVSVLIVHHAGKGGAQRGTSRREDVLDTSISLVRPSDYVPEEGARFEVHLEKARGVVGDAAKPFEAMLRVDDDKAIWTTLEIEDVNLARVKALLDCGMSIREIAEETGISKSGAHRLKQQIEGENK
jgi:hypothetical protein